MFAFVLCLFYFIMNLFCERRLRVRAAFRVRAVYKQPYKKPLLKKPICMFVVYGWLIEVFSWQNPGCKPAIFVEK